MEGKTCSVLEFNKILDALSAEAQSPMGKEQALALQPTNQVSAVRLLQQELSAAIDLLLRKGNPYFYGLKDITASLKRIEMGGVLNAGELLAVGQNVKLARTMQTYQEQQGVLDGYFSQLTAHKQLENEIFGAILGEDEISDNASPALSRIRRQIASTHGKIRESLNNIIHSAKYQKALQESIITLRDGRYVVPVKTEHKGDVGGIVHDMSASGSTLFIEPSAVVNANNQLRELAGQEQVEIDRILAALSVLVSPIIHNLFVNQRVLGELDLLFAKGKLALSMKAIVPKINDQNYIRIEKGRHPLLDAATVVPVSVHLGQDFQTLVITGPNTGGKTVTLKTIGLFCLMAAAGLAVPGADDTDLCVPDQIFADIGDEQSIEQSLSTFSSHMTNIVNIVSRITPKSLVLFDELGAGTDPTEGAALAIAILKYTKEMGALTVATTHYSEIKMYALSTEGVENASCEFDVASLRPTYRLLIGIPGKSNAFAISKKLGLPDFIIQTATNHLSEENIRFEDVISSLEVSRLQAESERQLADRYKRDIEQLKVQLEVEQGKIEQSKLKLTENAKREAKRIVEQAKQEAELIIEELKKARHMQSQADVTRAMTEARTKLNEKLTERAVAKPVQPNRNAPKNLIPGNTVELLDLGQTGTVLGKPKADGSVQVQVGIMKINTTLQNLRLVNEDAKQLYAPKQKGGSGMRLGTVKTELDLRGQLLEDALLNTEKYLDDAALAGLNQVTIIHGKGTGVLRKGVHDLLKRNPNAKSFRLGTYGEGEAGVTVVELN